MRCVLDVLCTGCAIYWMCCVLDALCTGCDIYWMRCVLDVDVDVINKFLY